MGLPQPLTVKHSDMAAKIEGISEGISRIPEILKNFCGDMAHDWLRQQLACGIRSEFIDEKALRQADREFLALLVEVAQKGNLRDIYGDEWQPVRDFLDSFTQERCQQGLSAWENATFILTLRPTIYGHVQSELGQDSPHLLREFDLVSTLLEQLGLWMMEVYAKIQLDLSLDHQQAELSQIHAQQITAQVETEVQAQMAEYLQQQVQTPNPLGSGTSMIRLWHDILALSLTGELESEALQTQFDQLLDQVAMTGATAIILDLTGIAGLSPETAASLSHTLTAAHLLGATCYLTGLRPAVAQTLASTNLNLSGIVSKAQLRDALADLLQQRGWQKPTQTLRLP
jgi:rsbT co-antagonist protein RsbR